jgi:hypothetical protein
MSVRVPLDCPCYDVKKLLIILSCYLVFLVAYTVELGSYSITSRTKHIPPNISLQ